MPFFGPHHASLMGLQENCPDWVMAGSAFSLFEAWLHGLSKLFFLPFGVSRRSRKNLFGFAL
jgi:hypothetical protein